MPANQTYGQPQSDADVERRLGPDRTIGIYLDTQALAAAGSSATDAGAITVLSFGLVTVSAADDTKGVKLPVPDKDGYVVRVKSSVSNKILKVYPHTGFGINALTVTTGAISLASGPTIAEFMWDATAGKWWTLPLLPS